MEVKYSKEFEKAARKLSGKMLLALKDVIQEVINAKKVSQFSNCKKLVDYKSVYRIRIGNYRAFFTFHVEIVNDTVTFQYLISRGEAYGKKSKANLRKRDKEKEE